MRVDINLELYVAFTHSGVHFFPLKCRLRPHPHHPKTSLGRMKVRCSSADAVAVGVRVATTTACASERAQRTICFEWQRKIFPLGSAQLPCFVLLINFCYHTLNSTILWYSGWRQRRLSWWYNNEMTAKRLLVFPPSFVSQSHFPAHHTLERGKIGLGENDRRLILDSIIFRCLLHSRAACFGTVKIVIVRAFDTRRLATFEGKLESWAMCGFGGFSKL